MPPFFVKLFKTCKLVFIKTQIEVDRSCWVFRNRGLLKDKTLLSFSGLPNPTRVVKFDQ